MLRIATWVTVVDPPTTREIGSVYLDEQGNVTRQYVTESTEKAVRVPLFPPFVYRLVIYGPVFTYHGRGRSLCTAPVEQVCTI